MSKPVTKMTARELVAVVKRILENEDLSDKAACVGAMAAIPVWEEARDRAKSDRSAIVVPSENER